MLAIANNTRYIVAKSSIVTYINNPMFRNMRSIYVVTSHAFSLDNLLFCSIVIVLYSMLSSIMLHVVIASGLSRDRSNVPARRA